MAKEYNNEKPELSYEIKNGNTELFINVNVDINVKWELVVNGANFTLPLYSGIGPTKNAIKAIFRTNNDIVYGDVTLIKPNQWCNNQVSIHIFEYINKKISVRPNSITLNAYPVSSKNIDYESIIVDSIDKNWDCSWKYEFINSNITANIDESDNTTLYVKVSSSEIKLKFEKKENEGKILVSCSGNTEYLDKELSNGKVFISIINNSLDYNHNVTVNRIIHNDSNQSDDILTLSPSNVYLKNENKTFNLKITSTYSPSFSPIIKDNNDNIINDDSKITVTVDRFNVKGVINSDSDEIFKIQVSKNDKKSNVSIINYSIINEDVAELKISETKDGEYSTSVIYKNNDSSINKIFYVKSNPSNWDILSYDDSYFTCKKTGLNELTVSLEYYEKFNNKYILLTNPKGCVANINYSLMNTILPSSQKVFGLSTVSAITLTNEEQLASIVTFEKIENYSNIFKGKTFYVYSFTRFGTFDKFVDLYTNGSGNKFIYKIKKNGSWVEASSISGGEKDTNDNDKLYGTKVICSPKEPKEDCVWLTSRSESSLASGTYPAKLTNSDTYEVLDITVSVPKVIDSYKISFDTDINPTYKLSELKTIVFSATPIYVYESTDYNFSQNDTNKKFFRGVSGYGKVKINNNDVTDVEILSPDNTNNSVRFSFKKTKINPTDNVSIIAYTTDKDGAKYKQANIVESFVVLDNDKDSYFIDVSFGKDGDKEFYSKQDYASLTIDEFKNSILFVAPGHSIDGIHTIYDDVCHETTISFFIEEKETKVKKTFTIPENDYTIEEYNYNLYDILKNNSVTDDVIYSKEFTVSSIAIKDKKQMGSPKTIIFKVYDDRIVEEYYDEAGCNITKKEDEFYTLDEIKRLEIYHLPIYSYDAVEYFVSDNVNIMDTNNYPKYRGVNGTCALKICGNDATDEIIAAVKPTDLDNTTISYKFNSEKVKSGKTYSLTFTITDGQEKHSNIDKLIRDKDEQGKPIKKQITINTEPEIKREYILYAQMGGENIVEKNYDIKVNELKTIEIIESNLLIKRFLCDNEIEKLRETKKIKTVTTISSGAINDTYTENTIDLKKYSGCSDGTVLNILIEQQKEEETDIAKKLSFTITLSIPDPTIKYEIETDITDDLSNAISINYFNEHFKTITVIPTALYTSFSASTADTLYIGDNNTTIFKYNGVNSKLTVQQNDSADEIEMPAYDNKLDANGKIIGNIYSISNGDVTDSYEIDFATISKTSCLLNEVNSISMQMQPKYLYNNGVINNSYFISDNEKNKSLYSYRGVGGKAFATVDSNAETELTSEIKGNKVLFNLSNVIPLIKEESVVNIDMKVTDSSGNIIDGVKKSFALTVKKEPTGSSICELFIYDGYANDGDLMIQDYMIRTQYCIETMSGEILAISPQDGAGATQVGPYKFEIDTYPRIEIKGHVGERVKVEMELPSIAVQNVDFIDYVSPSSYFCGGENKKFSSNAGGGYDCTSEYVLKEGLNEFHVGGQYTDPTYRPDEFKE